MLSYIEYLNLPTRIGLVIVGAFLAMQIVGELLELSGKLVPEFLKVRKYFARRRLERNDSTQMFKDMKNLLVEVKAHYSADNIAKRDSWMSWVNSRADVYDESIAEITKALSEVSQALRDNTKMTEEMFIQNSRDRIIDFATKVGNHDAIVSREEFNRIFKVHKEYEEFLAERGMTNGEVAIAYRIIVESYEYHMREHTFIEDIRGYTTDAKVGLIKHD